MNTFRPIKEKCQLCNTAHQDRHGLCKGCYGDLPWLINNCDRCALPVPESSIVNGGPRLCGRCLQGANASLTRSFIPFSYEFPINALISDYKVRHELAWHQLFSVCLADYLESELQPGDLPDLLLPMPLHKTKQRERGFNQSELIANPLGKKFGIRVDNRLCKRIKNTPRQAGLNRRERARNLKNAFQVSQLPASIEHIAIIDDVVTTGASCRALATALLTAGAKRIDVWAVARTSI